MVRLIGDYLRADRDGIYLWTPRFCLYFMWAPEFWEIQRQVFWDYKHDAVDRQRGNVSFGPFYLAWYPRRDTVRSKPFSSYHEFYGSMDEHWASVCKPYADKFREMTGSRGYFAVVDDERGTFVVVADKEFHAPTLEEAFEAALPEAKAYATFLNSGGTPVGWLESRSLSSSP